MTRTLIAATLLVAGLASARAQTGDMSCADYLKADAQAQASLSPEDKAMIAADPQAAAMDAKMRAYCKANPKASTSEAAMKAMQ